MSAFQKSPGVNHKRQISPHCQQYWVSYGLTPHSLQNPGLIVTRVFGRAVKTIPLQLQEFKHMKKLPANPLTQCRAMAERHYYRHLVNANITTATFYNTLVNVVIPLPLRQNCNSTAHLVNVGIAEKRRGEV